MSLRDTAAKLCWKFASLLPLDNKKILFCSYSGRGYSDSPKAIVEELLKRRSCAKPGDPAHGIKLRWIVKNDKEAQSLPDGIIPVPVHGFEHIKAYMTSKVWVDNCRKFENAKRPKQYYMQTWHGFALKRIEKDSVNLDDAYVNACKRDSENCDLIISGSRFMTGIYKNSFWYDGEVAETGTPRCDVFFKDQGDASKKVSGALNISAGKKLVLYAPTFRDDHSTDAYCIDADKVIAALAEKFGGQWCFLVRLHPNVAADAEGLFKYDGDSVINATMYPDMQELLLAADVMITDYSSGIFDYELSGKPAFQFMPDIEKYRQDRNFYFDLEKLPFPRAENNEELCAVIKNYDESAALGLRQKFEKDNGFAEDGMASARCADIILEWLNK